MSIVGMTTEDLPLRFEIGNSVVPEFAQSHAPTDVLRELVQNEYDAGGNELVLSQLNYWRDRVGAV